MTSSPPFLPPILVTLTLLQKKSLVQLSITYRLHRIALQQVKDENGIVQLWVYFIHKREFRGFQIAPQGRVDPLPLPNKSLPSKSSQITYPSQLDDLSRLGNERALLKAQLDLVTDQIKQQLIPLSESPVSKLARLTGLSRATVTRYISRANRP